MRQTERDRLRHVRRVVWLEKISWQAEAGGCGEWSASTEAHPPARVAYIYLKPKVARQFPFVKTPKKIMGTIKFCWRRGMKFCAFSMSSYLRIST